MRIVDGMVDNTHSTGTVAPTETVPTYQEILSTYDDMVAATAAANGAIAKPYAQLTFPVKKGDYTIVDGALKRALVDIATSETYTAAHWTDAKLGPDLSQLKSAIKDEDTRTNQILSLVNYGYDEPINYPIGDGSTWGKSIGIYRDGTTVKIHKPSSTTVDIRAKLSGAFALAGNNSGVNAWTSGLSFKTGHQYKITSRLIGGSAVSGSDSNYGGAVSVYPTGTSTSVGTATTGNGVNSRTFTAEESTAYNIVFYATKAAIFTNAVYLITIEDLTESEFVNLQEQIDEIKVNTEYTDIKLKSGNITDAGKAGSNNEYIRTYTGELPKIEKGDIISAENGFELVNVHIFNKNSVSSVAHVIKLTVSDANHFAIPDTYVGMYVGFTVYEPSKSGTDISGDLTAAMNSVKIAKEVSLAETIGNLNSRVYALETGESIPDYYFDDDYLDDKVTDINTIGVGVGVKSLRTVFITDYHYEDNARKSPALIEYLIQKTGIRSVVFGGDSINHDYASKVGGYNKICTFLDDFKKIREGANMFLITGNHEMNNADLAHDSVELPKSVPYSLFNEPIFYKIKSLWASGKNTNSFYVDDDVAKIRFYGIDCTSGASIQKAYLDVILPSFLTVPEGYAVVVFSHSGIESYTSDGETPPTYTITALTTGLDAIMQAGKAMNDGENATVSVTIGGTVYTWNLDFTGKARTFVGVIIGHSHLDSYYIYDSRFPVIAVLCDTGAYRDTHPARVAGTITEQAFDVIQIDIATNRIYCTRIGYGADRTFSFGEDAGIVT